MVDRILLGERSGQYGIWVSKPGLDVKTAGEDGLLLSTGLGALQALTAGSVTVSNDNSGGAETVVSIPFVPYDPLVLLSVTPNVTQYTDERGQVFYYIHGAKYRRVSNTQIAISAAKDASTIGYSGAFVVSYIVFARPVSG